MTMTHTTTKIITWHTKSFGLFQATIQDNKLTDFRCCENGSLVEYGNGLFNSNPEFLKEVRDSIDDLLIQLKP